MTFTIDLALDFEAPFRNNAVGFEPSPCKTCGAYGVLEPRVDYTEEEKEITLKAYQKRSSICGIERTFGVCRQTLSAW